MDPGWKRISVVLTLTRLPRGRQPDLAMVPRPFGWVYNTPLPERTTGLRNLASQLGALRRIISWSGGFLDGAAQSRLRSNFLNVFSTALLSQPCAVHKEGIAAVASSGSAAAASSWLGPTPPAADGAPTNPVLGFQMEEKGVSFCQAPRLARNLQTRRIHIANGA